MITAVDTNVLLDVFVSSAAHHSQSQEWLISAYDRGAILVCDVVYAELVPAFGDRSSLDRALGEINATVSPIDTAIAYEAGLRWSRYRQAGRTEGTNHRRLLDWSSCPCQSRHLSDPGPRFLRHLLSRVARTEMSLRAPYSCPFRVGTGTEFTELMNAGRWKSHEMPAHYTRNEEAGRGAVARYYRAT